MENILRGKIALITGGGQGLGRAFALSLLKVGMRVSLVDIKRDVGEKTETEFKKEYGPKSVIFVPCDVTNKTQLESAFQKTKQYFGAIDLVVNNAGIGDEVNWERMVAINLNAVIRGSKLGFDYMRKDNGGRGGIIVNISSLAGLAAPPLVESYVATKWGVLGFTRSLAYTYPVGKFGVRACCLCPSYTETEIMANINEAIHSIPQELEEAKDIMESGIKALGYMQPQDVANAFMRLIMDERAHGAVMVVTPQGPEYKYPRHLQGKL